MREIRPTYSSFSRFRRSVTGNIVVLPVLFEQALHSDLVIFYSIRLLFYSLQSVRPAGLPCSRTWLDKSPDRLLPETLPVAVALSTPTFFPLKKTHLTVSQVVGRP